MNKNILIGVVVVVLVAVGAFFMVGRTSPELSNNMQPAGETTNTVPNPSGKTAGTLATLLAMGTVKCDVLIKNAEMNGTAIVYVAGGKMRNEITANGPQGEMHMTMINDTKNIYTWGDALPQGIKMPVTNATTPSSEGRIDQGLPTDTPVEYSCAPWSEDASKFVPPSSVSFMELGNVPSMPKGIPQKQ